MLAAMTMIAALIGFSATGRRIRPRTAASGDQDLTGQIPHPGAVISAIGPGEVQAVAVIVAVNIVHHPMMIAFARTHRIKTTAAEPQPH
jgi:hypothetical protein